MMSFEVLVIFLGDFVKILLVMGYVLKRVKRYLELNLNLFIEFNVLFFESFNCYWLFFNEINVYLFFLE